MPRESYLATVVIDRRKQIMSVGCYFYLFIEAGANRFSAPMTGSTRLINPGKELIHPLYITQKTF